MPVDAHLTVLSPPSAHRVYEAYSDDDEEDAGGPWVPSPPPAETAPRYERSNGRVYDGGLGMRYGEANGAGDVEDDSEDEVPYLPPRASTPSRALTRADVAPTQYRSEVCSDLASQCPFMNTSGSTVAQIAPPRTTATLCFAASAQNVIMTPIASVVESCARARNTTMTGKTGAGVGPAAARPSTRVVRQLVHPPLLVTVCARN